MPVQKIGVYTRTKRRVYTRVQKTRVYTRPKRRVYMRVQKDEIIEIYVQKSLVYEDPILKPMANHK